MPNSKKSMPKAVFVMKRKPKTLTRQWGKRPSLRRQEAENLDTIAKSSGKWNCQKLEIRAKKKEEKGKKKEKKRWGKRKKREKEEKRRK